MIYCKTSEFHRNFILQIGNNCHFCRHLISQKWKLTMSVNVKFTVLQQFNFANLGVSRKLAKLNCLRK